jgi:hypothetical protein
VGFAMLSPRVEQAIKEWLKQDHEIFVVNHQAQATT